jgi:hypothetical protein
MQVAFFQPVSQLTPAPSEGAGVAGAELKLWPPHIECIVVGFLTATV